MKEKKKKHPLCSLSQFMLLYSQHLYHYYNLNYLFIPQLYTHIYVIYVFFFTFFPPLCTY